MDAVELARQFAAALHTDAVNRGKDPRDAYAFALAEADRRGLDVEVTVPGAAILDNGRATFVAADQLIIHEASGTPFEQALLVAHEIGHADLGDNVEDDAPPTIDPARSAEPSPIGLDRVVDYGRRQRREVQMDLFAREFLLPRAVVRQLHLDGGLSATEIATRFGAPFEVVAQQLFDALLLPAVARLTAKPAPDRELNEEQRTAATHRGPAYLLEAGPGTGKTQTLVARVEDILAEGVDPRRILLLTFSNKAAGEMAERIARKRPEAAAAMWIGTFHAFGLDLVRRFHAELGLPKDPRLLDRTEAVELLEQEFPRLGLHHYRNLYDPTQDIADLLAAISRAKDEVVDAPRYAALAAVMRQNAGEDSEKKLAAEKAEEVARVYAAYETLKRQAHCVDFGDLVALPVPLLESHAGLRAQLQARYDHILVDEYQDVNRSSIRLLTALSGSGRNLWAVGDAKQSIYRFRGASSYNLARFGQQDFPGGVRGRLTLNYRSSTEIVTAFSAFASGMATGGPASNLTADRGPSGEAPKLLTVDRADEQSVVLADTIEAMRSAGHAYRDQAVLCTGNDALANHAQNLERLGIPVLFLGSLFERPEVRDLLSLLTLLTDPRASGLVRVACRPEIRMSLPDVAAVLEKLRTAETPPASWWRSPGAITALSPDGQLSVTRLGQILGGFDQSSPPWLTLARILLDRTRTAATLAASSTIADRARGIALWQFMNFVRAQPAAAGLPIRRLLDRVRRLVRLADDRDLRQLPTAAQGLDAVRLMTVHGAKGLEFPVVYFPGLNQGTLPRGVRQPECPPPEGMIEGVEGDAATAHRVAQEMEQECLFYVAVSRARDRLFLSAPTRKSNGVAWALSAFVDRFGTGLLRQHVTPTRVLPPTLETADIKLEVDGALRFKSTQISRFDSCPRRFFYSYILQVGGRRTATPFVQMHDAVQTVLKKLVEQGPNPSDARAIVAHLETAFTEHGLTEHGYASDYRTLAISLVNYFASIREGHTPETPTALSIALGGEEILVQADDVLRRSDGIPLLRRINTGHVRKDDVKELGAATLLIAAQRAFPGAIVELVYLADQKAEPLVLKAKQLQTSEAKLTEQLAQIRRGSFPANRDARRCPACPAFFACGPTPSGVLRKKF